MKKLFNDIILFFKNNKTITRILALLLIPVIIVYSIGHIDILFTTVSVFVLLVIFFYLTFISLKMLFPYVDFKILYSKALENHISSSVVFLGLVVSLVFLIVSILRIIFR